MMSAAAVSALEQPTPVWAAVGLGLIAAAATWLGWALAALRVNWSRRTQAWALLLAAGAMILISLGEVLPSAADSLGSTGRTLMFFAVGCLIAAVLMRVSARLARGAHPMSRTALVIAVAIGLHNIPEGAIPVGMALLALGPALVTTAMIAAHNIVEGLAVAAPVIAAGGGRRRALWFTSVATIGEILGVLITARFALALDADHLGILLAVVAGLMVTVSATELAPAGVRLLRSTDSDDGRGGGTRTHDLLLPKQAR